MAGFTVNSWLTIDTAIITAGQTTITNYTNAVTGNRAGLFKTMNDYFQNELLAPFQKKADSDPINSIAILQSAKFKIKSQHIPQVHQFEVKHGVESGTVELSAPGGPDSPHFHEWMYSPDRITWTRLRASNVAEKLVEGLIPGEMAYFTHQLFVKEVGQGVSQIIDIRVN